MLWSFSILFALGAMDEETNELTYLGICLSALSLKPRVGKIVIMSHLIGCARASSFMAVAMSHKGLAIGLALPNDDLDDDGYESSSAMAHLDKNIDNIDNDDDDANNVRQQQRQRWRDKRHSMPQTKLFYLDLLNVSTDLEAT